MDIKGLEKMMKKDVGETEKNEVHVIHETKICGYIFKIYGTKEEPLFLAQDIAEILDYQRNTDGTPVVRKMLNILDDDEKLKRKIKAIDKNGNYQNRQMWFITKNGLKRILASSRKIMAKEMLEELENVFIYKKIPKQTEFELMLKNALNIHLNKANLDWNVCPFNNNDYLLTYNKAVFYETEKKVGEYRLDFYFPKFNLIVEYDEKHHEYQKQEDEKREKEIVKILENVNDYDLSEGNYLTHFIRVKQGEEFEGIITIISYLMHYAFVY